MSGAASRLRAELDQIQTQNRLYFSKRNHRKDEMLKHEERNDRVVEIKVEIAGLMRRKVNLAHPASAFRCNRERWERFYTQPPPRPDPGRSIVNGLYVNPSRYSNVRSVI